MVAPLCEYTKVTELNAPLKGLVLYSVNCISIKLLLKTEKEQKLEAKRIIANVINLEVNQEINQYSHEEFFKGMSDFIKAKQIATPEDQNNLANAGVLTMLDVLGKMDKQDSNE